ncbi:MAG: DUF1538 domain-containing protein [Clostridia bacterium]|nr:DUF1538 domain-containing protein [Clostridia bacterium]
MLEAIRSVMPIVLIVVALCLFFVPVNSGLMLSFLIGSVMIVVGMAFFTIGSEVSMTQIGTHIGAKMTKSRKIWLVVLLSFVLGVAITVAEPDLQVLAKNTPNIDTTVLIMAVSVGVGFFLVVSMLRIIFAIPLKWLLVGFYVIVFVLAAISDQSFLSVAFDSGGVTTGSMTVPFIMSLGIGVAFIRSDENAKADSFGLVALCSIGPILAVLILGFLYRGSTQASSVIVVNQFHNTVDMGFAYLMSFPAYLVEVAVALLPIILFFGVFQVFSLKMKKRPLLRILIGLAMTYIGLVLFLTGVNVGFSSLGYVLGESLISSLRWLLVPIAMVMGWFIISAEPAVHVLTKQVTELSAGAISEKVMRITLSIAISIAMGLAMVRVLTGISILWFMIPGYLISLVLAFFVPPTFTAIAFDAGGVASGPMTATFMLPFAMGACKAIGGSVVADAFGLVAMVAMMPLITVQVMGALSTVKSKTVICTEFECQFADDEVIELWEVS